jgi:hypothetical protein
MRPTDRPSRSPRTAATRRATSVSRAGLSGAPALRAWPPPSNCARVSNCSDRLEVRAPWARPGAERPHASRTSRRDRGRRERQNVGKHLGFDCRPDSEVTGDRAGM